MHSHENEKDFDISTNLSNDEISHTHAHLSNDGTLTTHTHSSNDTASLSHAHTHSSNDGTLTTHTHSSNDTASLSHTHTHTHSHENTKAVINRMSRAIGHMESIKKMVESGRDCSEVLIQISAVRSAINNIGKIILEDHIKNCVVDAIETGDEKVMADLEEAINKFIK